MPNFNQVNLIGHMTRDVEIRNAGSNTVGAFGLAINRTWNSSTGEKQEEVCFVDCEAWNKTAETLAQYTAKGHPVFVTGRLKLDQWEDKQGEKRSKLKVVVEGFQFLRGKDAEAAPAAKQSGYVGHKHSPAKPPPQTIPDDDFTF
jgi:single-strand DNA-binding protein